MPDSTITANVGFPFPFSPQNLVSIPNTPVVAGASTQTPLGTQNFTGWYGTLFLWDNAGGGCMYLINNAVLGNLWTGLTSVGGYVLATNPTLGLNIAVNISSGILQVKLGALVTATKVGGLFVGSQM